MVAQVNVHYICYCLTKLKTSALHINTCWVLLALKHSNANFHFHLNWFRVDTEFIRAALWSMLIGFVCDSSGSLQLQWTKNGKHFKYSRRYLPRPCLHWWLVVALISSCCQFKERLQLACHCSGVSSLPPIKLSTINWRVSASRFSSIVSLWNMIDFLYWSKKENFSSPSVSLNDKDESGNVKRHSNRELNVKWLDASSQTSKADEQVQKKTAQWEFLNIVWREEIESFSLIRTAAIVIEYWWKIAQSLFTLQCFQLLNFTGTETKTSAVNFNYDENFSQTFQAQLCI